MEKLPEEFKKKWLEALRSGEYKQGTSLLYNGSDDSYCCLGVAGRVAGVSEFDMDGECYFSAHNAPLNYPAVIVDGEVPNVLITMNDDDGATFDDIADYIEANL